MSDLVFYESWLINFLLSDLFPDVENEDTLEIYPGQITCGMSGIRSKAHLSPQEDRKHVKKQSKRVVIFPGILWEPLEAW